MSDSTFFAELKRRNVYKVAVGYVLAAWAVAQGLAQLLPVFDIPNWTVRLLIVLLILGFPVALMFAWAFEITSEGIKRTEEIDPAQSIRRRTGRKFVAVTIALGALALAATVFRFAPKHSISPSFNTAGALEIPAKSIAVLPFADLSQAKDQEYFCDGMSEELLDSLAKIDGLRVVARTSSFSFKGSNADVNEIGRKLNVSTVLEGSLRREGDRVRIS